MDVSDYYAAIVLIGRLLCGISTGISSYIVPLYSNSYIVREVAPFEIYARLGCINQFMITFGIFIAYLVSYFVYYDHITIYLLFSLPILFAITQAVLFIFCYTNDTPTYLLSKKRTRDALALISKLYYNQTNEDETDDLLANSQLSLHCKAASFKDLLNSKLSQSLAMGCVVSVLQQFTGINYIIFSSSVYIDKGSIGAQFLTIIFGAVNCISGSLGVILLKAHYKKNLQIGALGMSLCYLIILLSLFPTHEESFLFIYVSCTILFIICFEFSIGPIMWIYCADVLSEKGVAITSALNWFGVLVIGGIFSLEQVVVEFRYRDGKAVEKVPFFFMNLFYLVSCITVIYT